MVFLDWFCSLTLRKHSVTLYTHSAFSSLDEDECNEHDVCGGNATCINTNGSFYCACNPGFALKSGRTTFTGSDEQCEGEGRHERNGSFVFFLFFCSAPFLSWLTPGGMKVYMCFLLLMRWQTYVSPPICFHCRHMFDWWNHLWERKLPPET